jgi:hypothetical protein
VQRYEKNQSLQNGIAKQLSIMQKSGEILSDIIRNDLKTKSTETSFELNLLAMMKLKHIIKREAD